MAKKSNDKENAICTQARENARDGATYWADNWEAAEDDLKTLSGEGIWPSKIRTERELEGRPCLVNNVLPTFVDQILGDQRQNRPSIKVSAVDVARVESSNGEQEELKISNKSGDKDYKFSEALSGIIRGIEYKSDAETSYDIAFQSAVESGIGFLRVRTDWEEDSWDDQEFIIDHIEDQFSVTLDPNAKERDYSDMDWCIIDSTMLKDSFTKKYPDARSEPVNADGMGDWYGEKTVRVSEYFTREEVTREKAMLSDGRIVYTDDIEPILDELAEAGITIEKKRKFKESKVFWRKITGYDVLEGPIETNFNTIPVVPVWGKCLVIKKKKIFRSAIRNSKDAQRMSDFFDSAAAEAVALAPKAPFIGREGHIEGREDEWGTANTKNHSILTYVAQFQDDQGPRREQPAAVPAADITLGQISTEKIKATMGMFDASLGAGGGETSGKMVLARQRQGDRGSFAFIDNLSKAITRIGQIIVDAYPSIMDTERVARLKFQDDSEDFVVLNQQVFDDESNEWVTIHDLGIAKYDVAVTTGPAFATQRMEAAESMIAFAQAVPNAAGVMADLMAQNMNWPGADIIAKRLKKIAPPGVLTAQERKDMQEDQEEPQPPTPEQELQSKEIEVRGIEAQAMSEKAQAEVVKAKATTEKAQADIVVAQLETEEAQAKSRQIIADSEAGNIDAQFVKELIADALAEISVGVQN